jgi:DNA-binding XRE family transcriptional regulator
MAPMTTRLRHLRKSAKLRQEDLADRVGASVGTISRLETGEMRMTFDWARRLSGALAASPADLLPVTEGGVTRVPVLHVAGLHELVDQRGDLGSLPVPPGLRAPEHCAAVLVGDAHAARLGYPPGTLVIYRRLAQLGRELKAGDKVVVARYLENVGAASAPFEVLLGKLDQTSDGDIFATLASTDRRAPFAIEIQRPRAPSPSGLNEAAAAIGVNRSIFYCSRDDDPAEVLGVVALAMVPEE